MRGRSRFTVAFTFVWTGLVVSGALFPVAAGSPAAARPDLVVASITAKGSLKPGARVVAKVTTRNEGAARARRSTAKLFASRDLFRGKDDAPLARVSIPALAPGESVTKRISATVPEGWRGELLACADAKKVVAESREGNNCRAATDDDLDGWANFTDCAISDALVNPGEADVPDAPAFADTNCDRIDGTAREAVFVAPGGSDSDPGTRGKPKQTLAAAVQTAEAAGKDVFARVGDYGETLVVANGVGVYGGYGVSWVRTQAEATRIVGDPPAFGDTIGALAIDITVATDLQLITLEPQAPTIPGADSYGLRGMGSPGLRIDHATIHAAAGAAGSNGIDGIPGRPGGDGEDGPTGGAVREATHGGTSPVGRVGGNGGPGGYWLGYTPQSSGYDGGPGQSTTFDAWGRKGGDGGPGGAIDSAGQPGWWGDLGILRGNGSGGSDANQTPGSGSWQTADGTDGLDGTDGHGGGGGGGGGGEDCTIGCPFGNDEGGYGGGGGGGGEGGGGGTGGGGGGGSFGIYLDASSGAIVRDSIVTAADGGSGGAGAAGALGGAGGQGGAGGDPETSDAGPGGEGGDGGAGGRGGDGGGGAGGPSIAIFGLTLEAAPGTTVSHGLGGLGGVGGYGAGFGASPGAPGIAADYLL